MSTEDLLDTVSSSVDELLVGWSRTSLVAVSVSTTLLLVHMVHIYRETREEGIGKVVMNKVGLINTPADSLAYSPLSSLGVRAGSEAAVAERENRGRAGQKHPGVG